jgi:hypothetical protein
MSHFVTDIRAILRAVHVTFARVAMDARVDDATAARTE